MKRAEARKDEIQNGRNRIFWGACIPIQYKGMQLIPEIAIVGVMEKAHTYNCGGVSLTRDRLNTWQVGGGGPTLREILKDFAGLCTFTETFKEELAELHLSRVACYPNKEVWSNPKPFWAWLFPAVTWAEIRGFSYLCPCCKRETFQAQGNVIFDQTEDGYPFALLGECDRCSEPCVLCLRAKGTIFDGFSSYICPNCLKKQGLLGRVSHFLGLDFWPRDWKELASVLPRLVVRRARRS